MADLTIRSNELMIVIDGLVCHTSLKKAGRFRKAASRSLKVTSVGLVLAEFFGDMPLLALINAI